MLDNLEVAGGTALYDAAFESIQRVASGPAESKAVVLVTDGVDTASALAFDELREFARRKEVPVFSIGLDSGRRAREALPLRPGARDPGGGRPARWPGGRGQRTRRLAAAGPGWRRRRRRTRAAVTAAVALRRPGMPRRGFDERPLLELADDTGGRAEIVKGLQHYSPGDELPGRTASSRRSSRSR